jgi:hypothetical protein
MIYKIYKKIHEYRWPYGPLNPTHPEHEATQPDDFRARLADTMGGDHRPALARGYFFEPDRHGGTTQTRWAIWPVPAHGPTKVVSVVHPVGEGAGEVDDVVDPVSKGEGSVS